MPYIPFLTIRKSTTGLFHETVFSHGSLAISPDRAGGLCSNRWNGTASWSSSDAGDRKP
jgi:hypothetical protein